MKKMFRENTKLSNYNECLDSIKSTYLKKIFEDSFSSCQYNVIGQYDLSKDIDCLNLLRNEASNIMKLHQSFNHFLIKYILSYNTAHNKSYYYTDNISNYSKNIEENKFLLNKINKFIYFTDPDLASNKQFIFSLKNIKEIDVEQYNYCLKEKVSDELKETILDNIYETIKDNSLVMNLDKEKWNFNLPYSTYKEKHQKKRAQILLDRESNLILFILEIIINDRESFKKTKDNYGNVFFFANINENVLKMIKFYNKKIRQIKKIANKLKINDWENNAKIYEKSNNKNSIPELLKYLVREGLIYSGAVEEAKIYEIIRNIESHGFNTFPFFYQQTGSVIIEFYTKKDNCIDSDINFVIKKHETELNINEYVKYLKEKSIYAVNVDKIKNLIGSKELFNNAPSSFLNQIGVKSYLFMFLWSKENRDLFLEKNMEFLKKRNIGLSKDFDKYVMNGGYYSYTVSAGNFWLLINNIISLLDDTEFN